MVPILIGLRSQKALVGKPAFIFLDAFAHHFIGNRAPMVLVYNKIDAKHLPGIFRKHLFEPTLDSQARNADEWQIIIQVRNLLFFFFLEGEGEVGSK
jgi:hypothetical protein